MATVDNTQVKHIAKICHETNRAYCETRGDMSQPPWEQAPEWQRESAYNGVRAHLANPDLTAEQSHELWLAEKAANGWTYGRGKNVELKQHPCFRPYRELPKDQQRKDALFKAVVDALREPYADDRTNATEPFEAEHGVLAYADLNARPDDANGNMVVTPNTERRFARIEEFTNTVEGSVSVSGTSQIEPARLLFR